MYGQGFGNIMVNSISSQNVLNPQINTSKTEDIKTLVKYVNNESLKEVPDTFKSTTKSAVSSAALFEGLPLLGFLKKSKKLGNIVTSSGKQLAIKDSMKAIDAKTSQALKNIFKGEGSITSRVANYFSTVQNSKKQYQQLKDATKTASKVAKAMKKGNQEVIDSAIKTAMESADEFVLPGTKKYHEALGKLTKAKEALSKNPASAKLQKAAGKAAEKANKLNPLAKTAVKSTGKVGKAAKFLKSSGAGIMLVFSGISETISEIVPTFKELGKEKGIKQLGKSAIKVVGDTAGFIAGEQAGVALGSAIGTAIFPGVGTAIGAVCGFVGGMLGSFAAGKITKAITGPTEREKAKEQQQQQLAEDLAKTDLAELKAEVIAKVQEEMNTTGELSEDSQIALQTLENIENKNPFSEFAA